MLDSAIRPWRYWHSQPATDRRVGHAVTRHANGGWGCKCGQWFAPTQERAGEIMRDHKPDYRDEWRP